MNLNWDKKVIEECKRNLQNKKYKDESDYFIIQFYEDFLSDTPELEEEYPYYNKKQIIKMIKDEILNYRDLINELPEKYIINLLILMEGFGKKFIKEEDRFLYEIKDNTSNEELISSSNEIYQDISSDFNDSLEYIYENGLIRIDNSKEEKNPECFCDIYNKKGFVYYPTFLSSSRISCYNHELAHSIITKTNGDFYLEKNEDLSEFHSIFMENYSDNYMYDKTKNKMFLYSKYNSLDRFKNYIRNFAIISSLSTIEKNITKEEIIKKLYTDFGIDLSKNFNNYFNNIIDSLDIMDNYCYLFDACLSLNLLNKENLSEIKNRFSKSCFNNITRRKDFFKLIGFYINSDYYLYDILDNEFKNMDRLIRIK